MAQNRLGVLLIVPSHPAPATATTAQSQPTKVPDVKHSAVFDVHSAPAVHDTAEVAAPVAFVNVLPTGAPAGPAGPVGP